MRKVESVKYCAKCGTYKTLQFFNKCKSNKDGLDYTCRECSIIKSKKSYQLHREKRIAESKNYAKNNREQRTKYKAMWRNKNKERANLAQKIWREKNRETFNIKRNLYMKTFIKNNINYKISKSLRGRLRSAIKTNAKLGSAVKDLGCSIEEFKIYLESKFQHGMTWENWSIDGWHIDHILPLSSFDLTDPEQFKTAVHYTNLQPLWAKDNLSKNKYKNKSFNLESSDDKEETKPSKEGK